MKTTEILARFVAKNDIRFYLNKPFTIGDGFIYASNGHVAVRIPQSAEITAEHTDRLPNIADLFAKNRRDNFLDMFPELPSAEKCDACNGSGLGYVCPECDGDGDFEHGNHLYDCKECEGTGQSDDDDSGKAVVCWKCDGSGHAQQPVMVSGGSHADRRYLIKLHDLTGIKLAPGIEESTPLYFTFDGGEGVLMAMRA